MVSFGGKTIRSEGPGHNYLLVVSFGDEPPVRGHTVQRSHHSNSAAMQNMPDLQIPAPSKPSQIPASPCGISKGLPPLPDWGFPQTVAYLGANQIPCCKTVASHSTHDVRVVQLALN
ncbi:hypothetical protein M5K25_012633 [Dendrobium thyrsiflorum]|uniref:Uncharacterized protein n=1 Tax=Dendrobium thyrsiflorum TaxID=117978 RepID=A0ABD0UY13_DENTH